uniref:RUN domain-containing protein n=1 Tax=Hydatigena taeniaeformis TaxID=6205 RepID=A0A158RFA6_HYDTA
LMESFADFDNATIFTAKAPVDEEGKLIERWAPLGANDSPDFSADENMSLSGSASSDKLRSITEEHEILNSALLLITSHCAQVQFRLEQVLQADPEEKELLLKDLEQFAWKGVPDLHALRLNQVDLQSSTEKSQADQQGKNMSHMIEQLKSQLNDLEQFAYKSGEIQQPPTQNVLEKQRLVLEELGRHLDLNVSEFPTLTAEEIRERVNSGLTQALKSMTTLMDDTSSGTHVNGASLRFPDATTTFCYSLLDRINGFVVDEGTPDSVIGKALEAFRRYQQEARSRTPPAATCEGEGEPGYVEGGYQIGLSRRRQNGQVNTGLPSSRLSFVNQKTVGLITRALTMLQVFATMQLASRRAKMHQQAERYAQSAGTRKVVKHANGAKMHHWGDIRARLEMAVEIVLEKAEHLHQLRQKHSQDIEASPDSASPTSNQRVRLLSDSRFLLGSTEVKPQNASFFIECIKAERDLNLVVRKLFCPALEALIEHGSRLPASRGGKVGDSNKTSVLSSLLSLMGCYSRNRLEVISYPNRFIDNNDEEDEEDDGSDEGNEGTKVEDEPRRHYLESSEEKRARVLRKRNAQSSAWAIFLKYYILTVSLHHRWNNVS